MARPVHRPGNLPAEATSFIGRRRELAEVRARLGDARLVTLVGPGGVGKTRLAIRAATEARRGFPGGTWLVELAEVRDPALVAHTVLAALDLRDQAVAEPLALVRSYLRDRQLLLVVDNCEHLLATAAPLLAEVLRAAPGVRVIATSREPLSVPGEHVVPVPPLELPSTNGDVSLDRLRQNEAVTLFADRAAAGTGSFALDGTNRSAVVDLCRRLDGLPLAIELAAVRTRVLTPHQILDRLTDRFGLLTGGGRATLPRHQTLRTTIDWSHDLLTAAEQVLLRRLCVFGGRFTLEDVEGVCAGAEVPAATALDVLSSLVDKSLVLKEDVREVACYRLHETMREYAALKLRAAGETDAVELSCAEYYHATVAQSAAQARYRLVEWLARMDLEIDNVRSVLRWCVARGDTVRGLDLATSAGWYWITRATSEGIRWLDQLLTPDSPHGLAHFMRGFLSVLQTDPAGSRAPLHRAVAAPAIPGYPSLRCDALCLASVAAHMAGDREAGRRYLDAAHAAAPGSGDYLATISLLQARSLNNLTDGDLAAARVAATDGARLAREVGDLYALEMMLVNLGSVAHLSGDLDACRPPYAEALRIARGIDDRVAQYFLLYALGCHAAGTGRPKLAARLIGAAETVQAGVGATVLPHLAAPLAQAREATRAALGPARFDAEHEAGTRLDRETAIALALDEPAPDAPAQPAVPVPLGRRETEVARLVAEGLSNKQIAARLIISEHTVDTHVRGIFTKLGFTSRAQIAAWMAASRAAR